jgi:predicted ribosomally synthesized peptide with nif11-like leader
MSAAEVERFYRDLKGDRALRDQLKLRSANLTDIVAFAAERGYAFNLDDAKAKGGVELNESQLDLVAGGIAAPRDPQSGLPTG